MSDNKYEWVGVSLVFVGTLLSIIGTLYNNIPLDHLTAMKFWMVSNPMLLVWALGKLKGYWDGGVTISMLAVMYAVFTVTNWYGLQL